MNLQPKTKFKGKKKKELEFEGTVNQWIYTYVIDEVHLLLCDVSTVGEHHRRITSLPRHVSQPNFEKPYFY